MSLRTGPKNQCDRCLMYRPLCLCPEIPKLDLKTRLTVLMHWRERKVTSNTARMACLALEGSEIRFRGAPLQLLGEEERASLEQSDARGLAQPGESLALLYPSEDAVELTDEVVRQLPHPLRLIVPDGTWRQARKIFIHEPGIERIPKFKLPPAAPSGYKLRHSPHAGNLSTFEAIARAVGILEGPKEGPEIEARLLKLFHLKVERTLWSRGKLRARECEVPIPEEAILASHVAGRAGSRSPRLRSFEKSKIPVPHGLVPFRPKAEVPLDLEIGCGVGWHPIQYATRHPERHLIAIEHTREKFFKFNQRLSRHPDLTNLTAIHADATAWVTHGLPDRSISKCFILYPNPEPKARSRRWIRMPFFAELLRKLRPDGEILFVTNEESYAREVQKHAIHDWGLSIRHIRTFKQDDQPEPRTHFEKKYLLRGETCHEILLEMTQSSKVVPTFGVETTSDGDHLSANPLDLGS